MSSTSTSSCWAAITAALWAKPSTPAALPPEEPPLQEGLLLLKGQATTSRRETIRQLRERADALQRELQAATDRTEAAEVATRHAERRAEAAAAELHFVERTSRAHEERLREMEAELGDGDARIKLLEAILATLTKK